MPELPEVESIRRKLEPSILGKQISAVEIFLARQIETPSPRLLKQKLLDKRIVKIHRIGKYLFFELEPTGFLHIHLRMTGHLEYGLEKPAYTRLAFHLEQNRESLWYADSRTLGKIAYYDSIPAQIAALTDAVNDSYDWKFLYEKFHSRTSALKDVLLDQSFLAGIGNIYACEIAYRAKVSPYRSALKVTQKETIRIFESIQSVMQEAIAAEGTTFSDFRGADGKPGNFQLQLAVYDRAGEPCRTCDATIIKKMHHGRGTYHCPRCQK